MNRSMFISLFTASLIFLLAASLRLSFAQTTDLFISEYVEGSSNNKAIEIYNGTGKTIDLSGYRVELYSNGKATWDNYCTLSDLGTLADGGVLVLAHYSAAPAILSITDKTSSLVINFNGNDAVVLKKGDTIIDVIGQVGYDPGDRWGSEPVSTLAHTLRRKINICKGDRDPSDPFDPALEWEGFHEDTFDGLGSHTTNCLPCTEILMTNADIPENQPVGAIIGTFSAVDPDGGDSHTFYRVVHNDLGWGENGYFYLDRDNIQSENYEGNTLKTAAIFDYESKNSYIIYIRCNDNQGGSCFKLFTINIIDVNEAPTDLILSYWWVNEETPAGKEVGIFTTRDPDHDDAHTYSLVSGEGDTDNGFFRIEGNALKTAAVFDFETMKTSYSIRVRTTDKGGLSHERIFVININDMNEAPTDILLTNNSIEEHRGAAAVIGKFSTDDPNPSDNHTYSLISGEGDTGNHLFYINNGNILKTREDMDYETCSDAATGCSYSIRILSDDGKGAAFEKTFTIVVSDVNEAPTDILLYNTCIDENKPKGTEVGRFSATDKDREDSHIYTLVSGNGATDNDFFSIDNNTLRTLAEFDYEAKNDYNIRVRATDSQGGIYEKSFIITVSDEDEPLKIAKIIEEISISSDSENETIDLSGVFTDPDHEDESIHKSAYSSDPEIIAVEVDGDNLVLSRGRCGATTVTIAADSEGKRATHEFPVFVEASPGDINCDGAIDLLDAGIILKILTGTNNDDDVFDSADTDGNGSIGAEDLVYILQRTAEK